MTDLAAVDAYLAKQPEAQRACLERLRARIASLLPDAEQSISYGIPVFKLRGHGVVWIAGWKAHCSIYPLTDAFVAEHREDLAPYASGRGTLRFPPDDPPPDELIEALVRARAADIPG